MFYCKNSSHSLQNDAISWFLEVAKEPHQRTVEGFVIRILLLNFAGINTTSEVRNLADADSVTNFIHRHLLMHYFTWPPILNTRNPCAKKSKL